VLRCCITEVRLGLFLVLICSLCARAEDLQYSDLAGMSIEANIHRDQTVRADGHTFPVKIHQRWRFVLKSDKSIDLTTESTNRGPRGTRKAPTSFGTFVLGEPRHIGSRGGGEAVWNFSDGTLTFIRTYRVGAYRANFSFTRGPAGISCSVREALAREDGKGPVQMVSPFGAGQVVTILNSKQVSSDCTVKKQ
jgi:hypothetical protein